MIQITYKFTRILIKKKTQILCVYTQFNPLILLYIVQNYTQLGVILDTLSVFLV